MLEIENLHKSYGQIPALAGVTLHVERGRVTGLLGPNGAGKTTLVSIACGLRRPDSGSVHVAGIDVIADPERARRMIGFAPQDTGVYPVVSVWQNLQLFAELNGLRGHRLAERVDEVASALRLEDLLHRKTGELSGGQKRRLHTAIALISRPSLILADEATTGADVGTRAALMALLARLAREGAAVLYSTHYLGEIEEMDAHVAIMDRGEVIAEGSVATLLANNGSAFLEIRFDGNAPSVIPGAVVGADGSGLRIKADDPGRVAAKVFESLGGEARRVRSVEIVRPSLETVFLELTGRRYESEEDANVVAT